MLAGVVALLLMLVLMVLPLLFLLLFFLEVLLLPLFQKTLFCLICFASELPLENYMTQGMARNIVTSARLRARTLFYPQLAQAQARHRIYRMRRRKHVIR